MKHRATKTHETRHLREKRDRLPDMRPDPIAGPIAPRFPKSWRTKKDKHHGR